MIDRVGTQGDGIASHPDGGALFIPRTLPNERVLARPVAPRGDGWLAEAVAIIERNADRVIPECRHFGDCGGCAVQHWDLRAQREWKLKVLTDALGRAGYTDPPIAAMIAGSAGERRRMDLAVRRTEGGIVLGLHGARSARIVDLTECLLLHPLLAALLDPLRALLPGLQALQREASVIVNLLDDGPDLLLRSDGALTGADRVVLSRFAHEHGLARIAHAEGRGLPETACLRRSPIVTFSGVSVTPPPGAFLQATRTGEAAIVAAVHDGLPADLPRRAWVTELYAGCGTLTIALAARVRVRAWDGDAAAIQALRQAANHAGLAGRIDAQRRDLVRQPLLRQELASSAAVLLDPPYDGAGMQMPEIAASGVKRVMYVSCNPAALGRDAAVLAQAGYRLSEVRPIDQFVWSAGLETVATFVLSDR